jgi:poly-beta-1,6-N-acetyl-D-glucosamine synthase
VAQASAEKGRGSAYIFPAVVAVAIFTVLVIAWQHQSASVQSAILSVGWPVLYLVTVIQTLFMIRKLIRRQRAFSV